MRRARPIRKGMPRATGEQAKAAQRVAKHALHGGARRGTPRTDGRRRHACARGAAIAKRNGGMSQTIADAAEAAGLVWAKNTLRLKGYAPRDGLSKAGGALSSVPSEIMVNTDCFGPKAHSGVASGVKALVKSTVSQRWVRKIQCPNGECWNKRVPHDHAHGAVCTRACRFGSVDTGIPQRLDDAEEPEEWPPVS